MSYWRFAGMIATSTIVMFGLMYLNTYLPTHIFFSETRAYMALVMGAVMAIIMLAFMLSMYSNRAINAAIFAGAVIVFAGSLWLVRSQVTVGDESFMRAMIPHHSIAIMTSSRANISDARVRKLADEIIYAQDKEIAEMRYLVSQVANGIEEAGESPATETEIASVSDALSSPNVDVMDAGFLAPRDISALFQSGADCVFRYASDSPASLAIGESAALIKVNGGLVRLANAQDTGMEFAADGIDVVLSGLPATPFRRSNARMILKLDAGLTAGYDGFSDCPMR